jgi:hypothetical protein
MIKRKTGQNLSIWMDAQACCYCYKGLDAIGRGAKLQSLAPRPPEPRICEAGPTFDNDCNVGVCLTPLTVVSYKHDAVLGGVVL